MIKFEHRFLLVVAGPLHTPGQFFHLPLLLGSRDMLDLYKTIPA